MKAIINYYSKRSNPFTIIAAALLLASFITTLIFKGNIYQMTAAKSIWLIWLPCLGCAFYAIELVACGKDRLYMTLIPNLMMTLYLIIWSICLNGVYLGVLLAAVSAGGGVLYTLTVAGKIKTTWALKMTYVILSALLLLTLAAKLKFLGIIGYAYMGAFLMALSIMMAVFSFKPRYDDGSYVRRWGDRNDGRRVRTLSPMFTVSPYIMVERNDACNFIQDSVEITNVEKYIRKKRQEGFTNFGIMHVILASYVRAIVKYPGINRFINGQKIFSRDGQIEINMSIKKEMNTESPDTVIKVDFALEDTAVEVYDKMNEKIEEVKNTPLDSGFDNLAKMINYIPGIILKFFVWLLKTLDYFGLLPRKLTKLSPFHGSMFITSMGSLGIPPIFHHIYNFGNVPVFCAFGCKRTVRELNSEGNAVLKKYVDMAWVTDERICDGFYFASAMKYIKRILAHPEVLDEKPQEIISDRA